MTTTLTQRLVTNSSRRALLRRLLDGIGKPPPVARSARRGRVVHVEPGRVSESGRTRERGTVVVEFEAGTLETLVHPHFLAIRTGWPVTQVDFEGHEGPVFLWGSENAPRRLTEDPTAR